MPTKLSTARDDEEFFEAFKARIERTCRDAVNRGVEDPAVVMIDASDELAAAFAANSGLTGVIPHLLAEGRRRGQSLIVTIGLPRARAVALLAGRFPDVAGEAAAMKGGDGSYPVLVLAGSTARAARMPPLDEPGS